MRIKNKLFPYPVLNNDIFFSNYEESTFELEYNDRFDDDYFILENIKVILTNKELNHLLEEEIAKCVCIVECPQSMYRKVFDISTKPQTIKISLFNLIGKLEISAFIYANKKINNLISDDFNDVYGGFSFSIDKNSILAIDNGFKQRIDFKDKDDKKKSSIFVLISDLDETSNIAKWTYDENLIKISIPKLQHSEYEAIKYVESFKNSFLSMFAVTPLSFILSDFISEKIPVAELEYNYKWFKAFNDVYEKTFKNRLNDEVFLKLESVDIFSIVQKIFNYCVVDAIDDLFKICKVCL